ncbi:unnamed protein product [Brachionus calyciflorus]|uniref:Uncharacterized protein n=1 Tax=Brachionus calyciflorus TaxID=104777 RepID=A0A813PHR9_9BILA|nr:unnamed protein product [Brachionus calyciflorus]
MHIFSKNNQKLKTEEAFKILMEFDSESVPSNEFIYKPNSPKSYYHVIDKNGTIRNDFVKNVFILFGSKTTIPVFIPYVATLYENESEINDFEFENSSLGPMEI